MERMSYAIKKVQKICAGESYALSGWVRMLRIADCDYAKQTAEQLRFRGALELDKRTENRYILSDTFTVTDDFLFDVVVSAGGTAGDSDIESAQRKLSNLNQARESLYIEIDNLAQTHAEGTVGDYCRAYEILVKRIENHNLRIAAVEQDLQRFKGTFPKFDGIMVYPEPTINQY